MMRRQVLIYAAFGVVWLVLAWLDERAGDQTWVVSDLCLAAFMFFLAWREWRKR
jgi:hypothetical protein